MYSLCGSCRSFSWDCFNKISTLFSFSCKGRLFNLSQSEFVSCWYVRVRLVVSSNKPRLNMWSDNLLIRREVVRTAICSRKHLMHVRLAPSLSISSTAFLNFNHIYLFFFFFFFFGTVAWVHWLLELESCWGSHGGQLYWLTALQFHHWLLDSWLLLMVTDFIPEQRMNSTTFWTIWIRGGSRWEHILSPISVVGTKDALRPSYFLSSW